MAKFTDYLKNIFWLLLLLQIAPTLIKSIKSQYTDMLETKTKVGVITIKGSINNSDEYVNNLKNFFENDSIKAIVLKIDSPGGVAGASQVIFNEIKILKCKHEKYVVAFIENIGASGAYWIATAANYIIAAPSAFVGSIGSYISHPNLKELIEHYKVKYEVIKSGEYKTTGNIFLDLTDKQRALLQNISDNVYQQFTTDIAAERKNLPKDINAWADGKIFTGKQAYEIGLIDELGSQSSVLQVLKDKAKIEKKIEWVKPKKKEGLLYSLFYSDDDSDGINFKSFFHNLKNSVGYYIYT